MPIRARIDAKARPDKTDDFTLKQLKKKNRERSPLYKGPIFPCIPPAPPSEHALAEARHWGHRMMAKGQPPPDGLAKPLQGSRLLSGCRTRAQENHPDGVQTTARRVK